ncbi:MAG: protein tyrosine phosphatase [Acidobacteria bacterium]|nr:protein tyrosine phosphatase [Acidobacteriota bacterium]
MIDIHCHILPSIDDGARTLEESLALAELLINEGVTTVVATPHVFDLRFPTPTRDQILDRLTQVQEGLAGRLNVVCGAEVRLVPEVVAVLDRKEIFINTSPYMLVEFPSGLIPHGIEHLLFELTSSGVRPIIAHPERNSGFLSDSARLSAFVAMGCYAQLDAPCLLRKNETRRVALRWIETGLIHFVASDSHRCQWRPPQLAEARLEVEKECGADVTRALFVENPQAAVEGEPLPFAPEVKPQSKSVFSWWQGLWRG